MSQQQRQQAQDWADMMIDEYFGGWQAWHEKMVFDMLDELDLEHSSTNHHILGELVRNTAVAHYGSLYPL